MKKLLLLIILLPLFAYSQTGNLTLTNLTAKGKFTSPKVYVDSTYIQSLGVWVKDTASATRYGYLSPYKYSQIGTSQWTTTGSDIYYNTGFVGIGTLTPIVPFQVKVSGATTPTILLEDADITFPDYSGVGFAPLTTNSVLQISSGSSVKGGASIRGFTVNTPNTSAIALSGYSGIPMGTVSAISLIGWKHDGSTSRTTLANDEIILNIQNGTGVKTQILGNGFFGINKITPAYALDVSGTANSLYYLLNGTSLKKSIDTVKTTLATGLLKVTNGTGLLSTASAGTDYQAALTNPVTGTGTSGYLATWNGTSTITGATVTESSGALAGITTIGATGNISTSAGYIQSSRASTTTAYTLGLRSIVASAATSGVPVRNSGILQFDCSTWNTTPTAAAKTNSMAIGIYGISGTTTSSRTDFIDYMTDGVSTQAIRMSLTSAGLLGIGLTLPTSKLHIDAGTATASNLQFTAGTTTGQAVTDGVLFGIGTDAKAIWNNQENTSTEIYTNNTLATTIDASQNLTQVGTIITAASTTTKAGLRLPAGTAPSSPTDGDVWTDASGYYARLNGVTRNLYNSISTTGNEAFLGLEAGYSTTSGTYNTSIGSYAGRSNTEGNQNTFLGSGSGYSNTTGDNNVYLGVNSGYTASTTANNNVFIGWYSGYNTTKSNRFCLKSSSGGNAALDSTTSLMWGMFNNADLTKQYVRVNGRFINEPPHGAVYRNSDLTITATQNIWYKITGFTTVEAVGMTVTGDSIQLIRKGSYLFSVTTSFSGANNEVWELGVFKGVTLVEPSQLRYTSTSDVGNMSAPCYVTSDGDDWVSVKIRNTTDNDDPTIKRYSLIITCVHEEL